MLKELTRNEGKPENAIAKIVEGRLNGFYKDYVLLEQGFVRDPKTTVGKLVEGLGARCHRPPVRPRQDRRGIAVDTGHRRPRSAMTREPVPPSGAEALG